MALTIKPIRISCACLLLSSITISPLALAQFDPVTTFACPVGGKPLVIYSNFNGDAVTSTDDIKPAFVASGFKASDLGIELPQQSEQSSTHDLLINTRLPADTFIRFDLSRNDGAAYYVTSVQFPMARTPDIEASNSHEFVSQAYVILDNSTTVPQQEVPVRNYSFDADYRLNLFTNVKQLQGQFTAWSQAAQWDSAAQQRFTSIPLRFDIEPIANNNTLKEGFGAWVCGDTQAKEAQLNQTLSNKIDTTDTQANTAAFVNHLQ